jgi:predicted permease
VTWWHRLLRRKKMDEQLEKELRFHLEQHAADLIAAGSDPVEARRQARLSLGGPDQVKEECRDARGTRWLDDLWQDVRYALRTLRQKPGFAAVALLTLALGTGATTVMFTVINGVLLKPLPYAQPDRLVAVQGRTKTNDHYDLWNVAYLDFRDCQRDSRSLMLEGWMFSGGVLSEPGDGQYVVQFEISAGLLPILSVPVFRGRAFLPEEDRPGGTPVALLGYGLWQSRFGGSPSAIGQALVLDGKRYTVVGIVPASFRLDDNEADLYTPLGQNVSRFMQSRRPHPVGVIGRLRPGAALLQAQTELGTIGSRLSKQYPETNTGRAFDVRPLQPDVNDVRSTLWLLLGAVSLVMLIACVNVASLLLARAISRSRELAMRAALGAGRWRLIRQCLTESAVLGIGGGVLGILLAAVGLRRFVVFWPGSLPRAEEVHLDWRVLLFALTVSLASGLFFGLAPAWRVPVRDLEKVLRAGSRTVTGSSRRLHGTFVISEIALAMVLLVCAGMLARTLLRLSSLDPGVNIRNVLVTRMALPPAALTEPARIRAAWDDVLRRARRVSGVQSVALVDTVPMRQGHNQNGYWTNASVPAENEQPIALSTSVTPEYLKVAGLALHQGRFFSDQDRMGSTPVIVIDDVLAQQAFGKRDPIGSHLWIPDMGPGPFQVVGVVGHVRYWGIAGDDQAQVRAEFYYPFAQVPDQFLRRWSELMSIMVRTSGDPLTAVAPLKRELRSATGDQVLYQVRTMEQLAINSIARQRFLMLLFGIFAALALLLACIGIYGVLAYLTSQRVGEIGVRMALGASAREVMGMVMRQSLGMIFVGVGVGLAAALAAGRVMIRLVEGMRPIEPWTYALMILILVIAALIASFVPARRASRVDPVRALRQE